ncbi:hypothetical protein OSM86_14960, partial [Escherichia coli]|nr:hypothetical protein [Escherichia coli]
ADRNRSHWSTSKTPSYTKSVSWQHHLAPYAHHPKLISTLALARATLYKHLRELKPQGGPSNG